ncbi:hypothetical protein MBLNU457_7042t1 [Dothideomycetes sp. NU457]
MSSHNPELVAGLHNALAGLIANPYSTVESPETTKKRASVALIIRIQPHYDHWPAQDSGEITDLDSFFQQEWVKHGDPEVLFIKRAARKGDRWTSHIALPGGRRDPEDEDDLAAAIRETREEVGLDLSEDNALQVGNLPQRVVTTHWGRVPLMVLCPYIFFVTRHELPPLKLQPTEVASTHWVPLAALLSADERTEVHEDVSNRLANQETGVKRWMLRGMVGQMIFSAIRLRPSETIHCNASPAERPKRPSNVLSSLLGRTPRLAPANHERPLLLWGLTLGVVADFLDFLPPHNALQLWSYPTFTPWDVRLVIWLMTYDFKRRKIREISQIQARAPPAIEVGLDAVSPPKKSTVHRAGLTGISTGVDPAFFRTELKSSAVGTMLDGYYDIVRRAVALALIGRTTIAMAALTWVIIRYRRSRQRYI